MQDGEIQWGGLEPVRENFSCSAVAADQRNTLEKIQCQQEECGSDTRCYDRHLLPHANAARESYRKALRRLHPIPRAILGRLAVSEQGPLEECRGNLSEAVVRRTRCYHAASGMLLRAADSILTARSSGGTPQAILTELRSQTPPSFLAAMVVDRCGAEPSQECFDAAASAIRQELFVARSELQRALDHFSPWTILLRRCTQAPGNTQAECLSHRDWGPEYMVNAADVAFEPMTGVAPPPALGGAPGSQTPSSQPSQNLFASNEEGVDILNACQWGFAAIPRGWSAATACSVSRNHGELAPFANEITRVMARPNIYAYFDMLRLEAVTRFMRAHRELVGRDMTDAELPSCGTIRQGLANFRSSPVPAPVHDRYVASNSPEFRQQLRESAVIAQRLMREARDVQSRASAAQARLTSPHDVILTADEIAAIAEAERRLPAIRAELSYLFGAFPFLSAGRSHSAELWSSAPNVDRLAAENPISDATMGAARAEVSRAIAAAADRFCKTGGDDGVSWMDLVSLPELTRPIVGTMDFDGEGNPVWTADGVDPTLQETFRFAHACATQAKGDWETSRAVAGIFGGVGCAFATVASGGSLGPVCAGLFTAVAAREFLDARSHLDLIGDCRGAGGAVCNAEDYASARGRYDGALTGLALSVAFSVVEAPVALNQLRNAARFLRPSQLRAFAARISGATEREAIRRIHQEVLDAARANGASADDLVRAADGATPPASNPPPPNPTTPPSVPPPPATAATAMTAEAAETAMTGMRGQGGHAIRHFIEDGVIANTGSLASKVERFRAIARPILTTPRGAPFAWRIGGTEGTAYLGRIMVNGTERWATVVVAREGPHAGKVIAAILPDEGQLAIMLPRAGITP